MLLISANEGGWSIRRRLTAASRQGARRGWSERGWRACRLSGGTRSHTQWVSHKRRAALIIRTGTGTALHAHRGDDAAIAASAYRAKPGPLIISPPYHAAAAVLPVRAYLAQRRLLAVASVVCDAQRRSSSQPCGVVCKRSVLLAFAAVEGCDSGRRWHLRKPLRQRRGMIYASSRSRRLLSGRKREFRSATWTSLAADRVYYCETRC